MIIFTTISKHLFTSISHFLDELVFYLVAPPDDAVAPPDKIHNNNIITTNNE